MYIFTYKEKKLLNIKVYIVILCDILWNNHQDASSVCIVFFSSNFLLYNYLLCALISSLVRNNLKKFNGSFVFESICGPADFSSGTNCILRGIFSDFLHIIHLEFSVSSAIFLLQLLLSHSLSIIFIFRLIPLISFPCSSWFFLSLISLWIEIISY